MPCQLYVQTLIVQPVPVTSPLPILSLDKNRGGFGTIQGSLFSPGLGSTENGGIRPNNGATAIPNLFGMPPATKGPIGNVSDPTVAGGFGSNNQGFGASNQGFGSSKGFGSSAPFGSSTKSTKKSKKPHFDAKISPDTEGSRKL